MRTRRSAVAMLAIGATLPGVGLAASAQAGTTAAARAVREGVAWQLALESVGISPGLIDGLIGPKTRLATRTFQRVRGLPVTGELDAATGRALRVAPARALRVHTVTPADLAWVGPTAKGWRAKSRLARLGYPSALAALAERFHCPRKLLLRLNPALGTPQVGDRVVVPNVAVDATPSPAAELTIDMAAKTIKAVDGRGRLIGLFHCSIARQKSKRPSGHARVVTVVENPEYRFDPAMWPEVKGISDVLFIPAGPTNPVGLRWIGLSQKGYGIHGTPRPELIGKTGSHGCFRLTNWDAIRLARMVEPGTPVRFVP